MIQEKKIPIRLLVTVFSIGAAVAMIGVSGVIGAFLVNIKFISTRLSNLLKSRRRLILFACIACAIIIGACYDDKNPVIGDPFQNVQLDTTLSLIGYSALNQDSTNTPDTANVSIKLKFSKDSVTYDLFSIDNKIKFVPGTETGSFTFANGPAAIGLSTWVYKDIFDTLGLAAGIDSVNNIFLEYKYYDLKKKKVVFKTFYFSPEGKKFSTNAEIDPMLKPKDVVIQEQTPVGEIEINFKGDCKSIDYKYIDIENQTDTLEGVFDVSNGFTPQTKNLRDSLHGNSLQLKLSDTGTVHLVWIHTDTNRVEYTDEWVFDKTKEKATKLNTIIKNPDDKIINDTIPEGTFEVNYMEGGGVAYTFKDTSGIVTADTINQQNYEKTLSPTGAPIQLKVLGDSTSGIIRVERQYVEGLEQIVEVRKFNKATGKVDVTITKVDITNHKLIVDSAFGNFTAQFYQDKATVIYNYTNKGSQNAQDTINYTSDSTITLPISNPNQTLKMVIKKGDTAAEDKVLLNWGYINQASRFHIEEIWIIGKTGKITTEFKSSPPSDLVYDSISVNNTSLLLTRWESGEKIDYTYGPKKDTIDLNGTAQSIDLGNGVTLNIDVNNNVSVVYKYINSERQHVTDTWKYSSITKEIVQSPPVIVDPIDIISAPFKVGTDTLKLNRWEGNAVLEYQYGNNPKVEHTFTGSASSIQLAPGVIMYIAADKSIRVEHKYDDLNARIHYTQNHVVNSTTGVVDHQTPVGVPFADIVSEPFKVGADSLKLNRWEGNAVLEYQYGNNPKVKHTFTGSASSIQLAPGVIIYIAADKSIRVEHKYDDLIARIHYTQNHSVNSTTGIVTHENPVGVPFADINTPAFDVNGKPLTLSRWEDGQTLTYSYNYGATQHYTFTGAADTIVLETGVVILVAADKSLIVQQQFDDVSRRVHITQQYTINSTDGSVAPQTPVEIPFNDLSIDHSISDVGNCNVVYGEEGKIFYTIGSQPTVELPGTPTTPYSNTVYDANYTKVVVNIGLDGVVHIDYSKQENLQVFTENNIFNKTTGQVQTNTTTNDMSYHSMSVDTTFGTFEGRFFTDTNQVTYNFGASSDTLDKGENRTLPITSPQTLDLQTTSTGFSLIWKHVTNRVKYTISWVMNSAGQVSKTIDSIPPADVKHTVNTGDTYAGDLNVNFMDPTTTNGEKLTFQVLNSEEITMAQPDTLDVTGAEQINNLYAAPQVQGVDFGIRFILNVDGTVTYESSYLRQSDYKKVVRSWNISKSTGVSPMTETIIDMPTPFNPAYSDTTTYNNIGLVIENHPSGVTNLYQKNGSGYSKFNNQTIDGKTNQVYSAGFADMGDGTQRFTMINQASKQIIWYAQINSTNQISFYNPFMNAPIANYQNLLINDNASTYWFDFPGSGFMRFTGTSIGQFTQLEYQESIATNIRIQDNLNIRQVSYTVHTSTGPSTLNANLTINTGAPQIVFNWTHGASMKMDLNNVIEYQELVYQNQDSTIILNSNAKYLPLGLVEKKVGNAPKEFLLQHDGIEEPFKFGPPLQNSFGVNYQASSIQDQTNNNYKLIVRDMDTGDLVYFIIIDSNSNQAIFYNTATSEQIGLPQTITVVGPEWEFATVGSDGDLDDRKLIFTGNVGTANGPGRYVENAKKRNK